MVAHLPLAYVFGTPVVLLFGLAWMVIKPPAYGKYRSWIVAISAVLLWAGGTLNTFNHVRMGQPLCVMGLTGLIAVPTYLAATGKAKKQLPKIVVFGFVMVSVLDVALIVGLFRVG